MQHNDISDFEVNISKGPIKIRVMELENGVLLLVSDSQNFRLGLSALAVPPGQSRTGPSSTGLFSMGIDATIVRTIAERVAAWTNRTCMAVIAVNGLNQGIMMELVSVLKIHFVQ